MLLFARGRAWFAVSGIDFAYYLRFRLTYHYPHATIWGTPYIGPVVFDFVVTWIEYAPWFLWLIVAAWNRCVRSTPDSDEARAACVA